MREEDLCAEFKVAIERCGWVAYPETAGWDMLLVGPLGVQMGVEAKLRGNVDVLAQAVGHNVWPAEGKKGPDYRAVLVPKASSNFIMIAGNLHVLVYTPDNLNAPYLEIHLGSLLHLDHYMCWRPGKACWTPPVPINVPAGVPSPASVSKWKIAAVQLCMRLNQKGYVTSRDFTELKIAMSPFWRYRLQPWGRVPMPAVSGVGTVMLMRYIRRPGTILPDEQFPEITTALNNAA